MTREEAIEQLELVKRFIQLNGKDYLDERDIPILDMAIEALEVQPCDINTCKVIKALGNPCEVQLKAEPYEMRNPTEQEQKSIDDYVESISKPTGFNAFGDSCLDCVSREAVLNILPKYRLEESKIAEETKALPSITPERPKGEWISAKVGKLFPSNDYKCSKCGNILDFDGVNVGRGDANFCPNCGADMRGKQK